MANLYKKPIIRIDPRTGQKINCKSAKWWGRYRDALSRDRRVPLAKDKAAAQAMLNELVRAAELEAAGRIDPFEKHAKRPLANHIDEFEQHLRNKGNSEKHVSGFATKVRRIATECKWAYMHELSPSRVQRFLADLRASGFSVQTSNHYLRSIKQFSRWLVRDRRSSDDPLAHLAMMNSKVDRRHDRRALSPDEFSRLIEAAEQGPPIETISGRDRATMYVLSAWTGYRKNEIGSLTKRSLRLVDDPPTATVQAAYSKRKRQDTQVLHPEVADRLKAWLSSKPELEPDSLLFQVSGNVPGGTDRKTGKMMRLDLEAARRKWIDESETNVERTEREDSDFLSYCDASGRYADFHSNRHTFITTLERSGISPRTAQSLARHSDIRLTMGVYTHIELHDQQAAIERLPAPPGRSTDSDRSDESLRATGTDDVTSADLVVPTMVPRGAENGAIRLASNEDETDTVCTEGGRKESRKGQGEFDATLELPNEFRTKSHRGALPCTLAAGTSSKARPAGLEPATCGLEVRCSIRLSYGR